MLNLTQEERRVLLFLFTVVSIGLGLSFSLKTRFFPQLIPAFSKNLGKVDLNKADKAALMSVKGIGEKLAGRIIAYRNISDGFAELDELKQIKGITERKYEQVKGSFYIDRK